MLDAARVEKVPIEDLLASADGTAEFRNEFAAQFLEIPAPPTSPRLQVELVKVIKTASSLVFLISAYSFVMWALSGFALIHPLFSILTAIAAVTFFLMGTLLERRTRPG